jgi:hypothetical protein
VKILKITTFYCHPERSRGISSDFSTRLTSWSE